MPLTKVSQAVQASVTNAAAGTTTSDPFSTYYGVSGVAVITNGGVGPTVPCDFIVQVSDDGTNWYEWSRQSADNLANLSYVFPFGLGPGGNGGDFRQYRVVFTGNTVQGVTVQAKAQATTVLN